MCAPRELPSFPTRRSSDLYPPFSALSPQFGWRALSKPMQTANNEIEASPASIAYSELAYAEAGRIVGFLFLLVGDADQAQRSEEHTSELQSHSEHRMPSSA